MANTITFVDLAAKMAGAHAAISKRVEAALLVAAERVRDDARQKFGTYQPQVGPFKGWALLNPEYVQQKLRAGASGDDPLIGYYASGHNHIWPIPLRDSLEIQLDAPAWRAIVGTRDPLAPWHEFGLPDRKTPLPPRPFLRPALWQNRDWVFATIADAVVGALHEYFSK
jgi:hypothetical protein